jgi:dihydropteroate synthase
MQIVGIVNVTRDSFSDGGRWIAPDAAIEQARRLRTAGADWVELGAESSHPDAEDVPEAEEIARLLPIVRALRADDVAISIDTCKAGVMRTMLAEGAACINDITALRESAAVDAVRDSNCRLVLMHAVRTGTASGFSVFFASAWRR